MDKHLCQHQEIQDAVIGCVSLWQQNDRSPKNGEEVGPLPMQNSTDNYNEINNTTVDVGQEIDSNVLSFLHPQCSVIQVTASNEEISSSTSYTTTKGSMYNLSSNFTFEIVTLRHFDTVTKEEPHTSQTRAAAVQLKAKNFHSQISCVAGFLVLLLDRSSQWRCISAAFAVSSDTAERHTTKHLVKPTDMKDVISCVWDGYCGANRACDGTKMAEVFHETCRLTYVDVSTGINVDHGDDGIRVWDCNRFCQKVTNRYTSELPHIPFAHLKDDPLVASGDELLGVEFAESTPYVAMITLKVGHPPFLWTDLLTCAKLGTRWYIVHKSSTSEPFLTHLAVLKTDDQSIELSSFR